jgi:hypothetical protein
LSEAGKILELSIMPLVRVRGRAGARVRVRVR